MKPHMDAVYLTAKLESIASFTISIRHGENYSHYNISDFTIVTCVFL